MASFQEIIDGLNNENPEIRKKCVLLLARTNNPKIIKFIEPLVNDINAEVKALAQKILFVYSQKFNQNELINEKDREIIAENNSIANSSNSLTNLLDSLDYKEKIITLESINENNTEIINILKSKIKSESNEFVIATYIKVISKLENKSSIDFLRPFLRLKDSRIKANAIDALSPSDFSYDTLIELLPSIDDNDERVKIALTQYISQINDNSFWTELEKIFNNNNSHLFIFAIKLSLLFKPIDIIKFYDNKCDIIDITKIPFFIDYLKNNKLMLTKSLNNLIEKFQNSLIEAGSSNLPEVCKDSFELSRASVNNSNNDEHFLKNLQVIPTANGNDSIRKTFIVENILTKLYIKRIITFSGLITPISIFVNDNLITSIIAGQIIELHLYPGDKNLSFSLLNNKSQNIFLSIKPQEVKYATLKVKSDGITKDILFEEVEPFDVSRITGKTN